MAALSVQASELVRVAPAVAFELFTQRIGDWYRVDKYTVPDAAQTKTLRLEGFVGGQFLAVTDETTGAGDLLGTVSLWEPPTRFVFVDLHQCDVEVSFKPTPEGTLVKVEVHGVNRLAPTLSEQVRRFGWHTTLTWFEQWSNKHDGK